MTVHVIKRWRRTLNTGWSEEWQSHFSSFDGALASQNAMNCAQALSYGFIADSMKEGMSIAIEQDQVDHIRIVASKNDGYRESVDYFLTTRPNEYENYTAADEHHEI